MGYGLLICLGIIIGVCLKIHSMSFMKKLAVKIVLVYVTMGWLALCIYMVVFSAIDLYDGKYGYAREERLLQIQRKLGRGNMEGAMTDMYYDKSYEAEFEYAWERCAMYRAYNRYSLFTQASDADQVYALEAERYRQQLLQICTDSECPENKPYVELYLRELE